MPNTYKKLSSYFLQRDLTTTTPGSDSAYYYGGEGSAIGTTTLEDFNSEFGSVKVDETFLLPELKNVTDGWRSPSRSFSINTTVTDVAINSYGQIIVVGGFTSIDGVAKSRIARLNADGTLDTTFYSPSVNNNIFSVAVQSDDKILIGGTFTNVDGVTRNRMARLNADGTLDTSFNPNFFDAVLSIKVLADGKILAGGYFDYVGGTQRDGIARLFSNGTLDTSFNAQLPAWPQTATVKDIYIQTDGKILIAGQFSTVHGQGSQGVARLNSDGTPDSSFDMGGFYIQIGPETIAQLSDGRIAIGGDFYTAGPTYETRVNARGLAILTSTGNFDDSMIQSITPYFIAGDVNKIVPTSNGGMLLCGPTLFASAGYNYDAIGYQPRGIVPLNADLSIDTSFTDSGTYNITSTVYGLTKIDNSDSYYFFGYITQVGFRSQSMIGRIVQKILDVDRENLTRSISQVRVQEDEKILAVGAFRSYRGISDPSKIDLLNVIRINKDGTLDTDFIENVKNISFLKYISRIESVEIQPDGKIILAGVNEQSPVRFPFTDIQNAPIVRLHPDGRLDAYFDTSGIFENANTTIHSMRLQPDGKIIINGSFSTVYNVSRSTIARLNADGTLDTSFNPNVSEVYTTAIQPDGKILIGGFFTSVDGISSSKVARLNADGTVDPGFFASVGGGAYPLVWSIALQSDGKILIGGTFAAVEGNSRDLLARLNDDGSLDSSFDHNVGGSSVNEIFIQPDNKIMIAGNFAAFLNGVSREKFARLSEDGSLDLNFNINIGEGQASHLATLPDGKILISGTFDNVNGVKRFLVAKLKEVVSNAPYRLAYTVPANTQVIIKNIFATNHNDFPVFHDIAILPESESQEGISEKHYYVWDSLIDENEYEVIDGSITLSAGDEIYVYSSTDEDISYNIFGAEITQ